VRRAALGLLGSLALIAAALGCGDDGAADGAGGEGTGDTTATGTGGSADPDADPDADFLTDAQEAEAGTDPTNPDTDGDTYLDGDEVLEGSDPLDPGSRIYTGGWPYQRDKDTIVDPGFEGTAEVGGVLPRLVTVDQFGEEVDIYDFALHGKPIVIDLSAIWCEACKDLARWLEGKPSNLDDSPEYAPIVDRVRNGEILWITVLFEDEAGNAAGPEHAAAWGAAFPDAPVPVLADDDRAMKDFLFPGSYPSIQVLGEDMTLQVYDRYDYTPAFDALL
jgi:thiol-disulfide isomerase/thioredoxin